MDFEVYITEQREGCEEFWWVINLEHPFLVYVLGELATNWFMKSQLQNILGTELPGQLSTFVFPNMFSHFYLIMSFLEDKEKSPQLATFKIIQMSEQYMGPNFPSLAFEMFMFLISIHSLRYVTHILEMIYCYCFVVYGPKQTFEYFL